MHARPSKRLGWSLGFGFVAAGVLVNSWSGCAPDLKAATMCEWIQDPKNCHRAFFDEIRTRCGKQVAPADIDSGSVKATEPKGSFASRDTMDICTIYDQADNSVTGQVVFDPPLTIDQFPLQSINFARIDARSSPCAIGHASTNSSFSLTILPCSQDNNDDWPVCKDAFDGISSYSGSGRDPDQVVGGMVSIEREDGKDVYVAGCPSGSTIAVHGIDTVSCDGFEQLIPHGQLESDSGRIAPPWEEDVEPYEGWVRFRVYYIPFDGKLQGANPTIVQYFNCVVPFLNPCNDGVKNFYEVDVDCGGPWPGSSPPNQPGAQPVVRACPRCKVGQLCESDYDCEQDEPTFCVDDPVTGSLRCERFNSGSGGYGGGI